MDSNVSSWQQHHTLLNVTVFFTFCIVNLKFWVPDSYLGNACTFTLRKLIPNEERVCVCVCVCECHKQCTNLSTTARSASHRCISWHTQFLSYKYTNQLMSVLYCLTVWAKHELVFCESQWLYREVMKYVLNQMIQIVTGKLKQVTPATGEWRQKFKV